MSYDPLRPVSRIEVNDTKVKFIFEEDSDIDENFQGIVKFSFKEYV